jgi:hypothetical protein
VKRKEQTSIPKKTSHTQIYPLYLIVKVALNTDVLHPFGWNNHPVPNIPVVGSFGYA